MPNKKIDQTPAAPERPIVCAFCQKELDSLIDEFTFIGIGKWRDGPALFHAVCSSKTEGGQENPCFLNGMSWAMKFTKEQPALLTYQEWKARPIRRSVKATRAENGKYELLLLESHLNCIYFLEMKKSLTVSKAKELVLRWQDEWGLDVESVPDIERIERDASDAIRLPCLILGFGQFLRLGILLVMPRHAVLDHLQIDVVIAHENISKNPSVAILFVPFHIVVLIQGICRQNV